MAAGPKVALVGAESSSRGALRRLLDRLVVDTAIVELTAAAELNSIEEGPPSTIVLLDDPVHFDAVAQLSNQALRPLLRESAVVVVTGDGERRRAAMRAGAGACIERVELDEATLQRALEDASDRVAATLGGQPVTDMSDVVEPVWPRIQARLGICPSFFTLARAEPPVVRALYEFTELAFLDNPIPAVLKQKLFVYLSRYCPVPYCLARQCAFLLERERIEVDRCVVDTASALALLEEPLPTPEQLAASLAALEQAESLGRSWPRWDTPLGEQVRIACAQLLVRSSRATRWIHALRRVLGHAHFEQLALFLAYVRMAHFWTGIHPDIEFEPDLSALLREQRELADALASASSAAMRASDLDTRMQSELDELRERVAESTRLRQLADAIPAFVSYVDTDQRYVFLNQTYVEKFGRPASEMCGLKVPEVVGPVNYEEFRGPLEQALRGQGSRAERRIYLPDGSVRLLDASCVPDRLPDGTIAGAIVMAVDITERRRAQDLTRQVLDNLFAFVGILERDGTVIEVNVAPLEAGGLTLDDVRGKKFWDCYWATYAPEIQAQLRDACVRAAAGETVRYDVSVRMREDTRMIVDFQIAPLRDVEGRITHLIPSGVDVTHRVEVEQRLRESEERSRLAQRAGRVGVWEYDPNTKSTFWSDTMWDIYGSAAESGMDPERLFFASVHPDDRGLVGDIDRLLREPEAVRVFRIIRPDQVVRWIESSATTLDVPQGGVPRIIGVNIDVTDLKQAEVVLRESEERLRMAKDAARLGIHDYDLVNGVIRWDERCRELWGVGPDEPITRELYLEGVHPDDRAAVDTAVDKALDPANGGLYRIEHRVVNRRDGQVRWVAVSGQTTFVDSEPVRAVGTVHEITARKLAEEELHESREQLRESDRRKDEFLAMLGHELRNPLAAICSAAELLRLYTGDDARLRKVAEVLDRQSKHMVRLVDGLLDISRIARGKIDLEWKLVDVREVLSDVLHDRAEQLERSGLVVDPQLSERPLWVRGDEVRLVQVFDNLIGNALKFTTAPGRLRVLAEPRDDSIVVVISDTGAGIRPDMLDAIFEPFLQDARARLASGLGIGLALVRGLVELHHGSVIARSEGPGTGAEFEVRLPSADRE